MRGSEALIREAKLEGKRERERKCVVQCTGGFYGQCFREMNNGNLMIIRSTLQPCQNHSSPKQQKQVFIKLNLNHPLLLQDCQKRPHDLMVSNTIYKFTINFN